MKNLVVAVSITLASFTAFADRNEDCSNLRAEIKYTESLIKYAIEQQNKKVLPYLLEIYKAQKEAHNQACTIDI